MSKPLATPVENVGQKLFVILNGRPVQVPGVRELITPTQEIRWPTPSKLGPVPTIEFKMFAVPDSKGQRLLAESVGQQFDFFLLMSDGRNRLYFRYVVKSLKVASIEPIVMSLRLRRGAPQPRPMLRHMRPLKALQS